MKYTVISWQDATFAERVSVYECYRANPGDDMTFEEFDAMWRNCTFKYVKSLFPAD